jgi:hypothetical protein
LRSGRPDENKDAVEEAYDLVLAIADLKTRIFKTPGAGNTARPFRVERANQDGLTVRTSQGGFVPLRPEAFAAGVKALADLGATLPERWVPVSDDTLAAILSSENREKAATSYVLPLLEAAGLVELDRSRPAKARVKAPSAP